MYVFVWLNEIVRWSRGQGTLTIEREHLAICCCVLGDGLMYSTVCQRFSYISALNDRCLDVSSHFNHDPYSQFVGGWHNFTENNLNTMILMGSN